MSCIEPGPVDTPMLRTIGEEIEEVDEARTDIDKDLAGAFSKICRTNTMINTPSEVVDVIVTAIEAEKPVLRYPVGARLGKLFSVALGDTTGETTVQIMTKTIED